MSMYLARALNKNNKMHKKRLIEEIHSIYRRNNIKYYGGIVAGAVMYLPIRPMHYRGLWWTAK